ncbi:GNAT superfamily N-acetyltransferase [Pseudarthrobacter sp. W1I19]|nr:GNAT superfamily N-acetyltransferase [Pseudarthrobacter sp. W1I19]
MAADMREAGIGGKIMHYLERRAELAGCDRLELDTGIGNHVAQRFYRKNQLEWAALHFSKNIETEAI